MFNKMNRAVLSVKLAVLLFVITVKADEGGVSFSWGNRNITLTCPEVGDWFLAANEQAIQNGSKTLEKTYDKDFEGLKYHCRYGVGKDEFYHFYIRGKTCEWCVEVTKPLLVTILVVDVLVTMLVIMLVYLRAKRNISARPPAAASKPAAAGRRKAARQGAGPPTPSPDYEQLNMHTRSPDTYSTVHRMG